MVEIAARIVLNSDEAGTATDSHGVDQVKKYWAASQCRLESWRRAFKLLAGDAQNPHPCHNAWPATQAVVEEVLVSEVLTRLWSAVLAAHDKARAATEFTGIANSVFVSHLDASNQALRLLVEQPAGVETNVDALNRFRHRLERWTDLLLASISDTRMAARFCFDRHRLLDFATDRLEQSIESRRYANHLLLASLSADLAENTGKYPANPELNRQIASGVLEFLNAERFDSVGLLKSSYVVRLEKDRDDLEQLVAQLDPLFPAGHQRTPPDRFSTLD
jgi:hypothetical protein